MPEDEEVARQAAERDEDEERLHVVEGDRVESEAEYMGRFRWLPSCMVHWLAAQAQDDRALWLLGPEHRVRVAATALVAYKVESMPMLSFDNMIIVVIILSSATM